MSLGENGSGTLVHARQVLAAWNIKESEIKAQFVRPALAAEAMRKATLDAFFVIDDAPVPSVAELAKAQPISLVPIAGEGAEKLRRSNRLLLTASIAAGTYEGVIEDVPTLQMGSVWLSPPNLPESLVYGITKALWHPTTTYRMLAESQPQGAQVKLSTALSGLGTPLHPGAARFYEENRIVEQRRGVGP